MLAVIRAMLRAGLGLALGALLLFLLATPPAEWSVRAAPALAAMAHFPGLLEADPMLASLRLLGLGMLLGVPLAALLQRLPWLAPGRGLGFAALALALPAWALAPQLAFAWTPGPTLAVAGMAWTAALAYALPWRAATGRPMLAVLRHAPAGMAALLAVQLPLELYCRTGGLAAALVQAKHWRRPDESLALLCAWLALALGVGLAARLVEIALAGRVGDITPDPRGDTSAGAAPAPSQGGHALRQLGLALVLLHLGAALLALLPHAWPGTDLLARLMAGGWPLVLPVAAAVALALPLGGLAGLAAGLHRGTPGLPPLLAMLGALPLLLAARMEPEEPTRAWWLALLLPALAGLYQAGRVTGARLSAQGFAMQAKLRGERGLALALTLLPHAMAPLLAAAARQAALLLLALAMLSSIGMALQPFDDWGGMLLLGRGNGGPHDAQAVLLPVLWLCSLAAGLFLLGAKDPTDA